MGIFDRIGAELERTGHKFDKEVLRPYAREFERIPIIGDFTRKLHEGRVAQRDIENEQFAFQEDKRRDVQEQQLSQTRSRQAIAAARARERRMDMAASLVGYQVGVMGFETMQETDMSVNNIPSMGDVDEQGNTIPEV